MSSEHLNICKWCNQQSAINCVHGHGQCSVCGINIDECCRGEEANQITTPCERVKVDNVEDD